MLRALKVHGEIYKRGGSFMAATPLLIELHSQSAATPGSASNLDALYANLETISNDKDMGFLEIARGFELVAAALPGQEAAWLDRIAEPLVTRRQLWDTPKDTPNLQPYLLGVLIGMFRAGAGFSYAERASEAATAYHRQLITVLQQLLANAPSHIRDLKVYPRGGEHPDQTRAREFEMFTRQFRSELDEAIKHYLAAVSNNRVRPAVYAFLEDYLEHLRKLEVEENGVYAPPRVIELLADNIASAYLMSRIHPTGRIEAVLRTLPLYFDDPEPASAT